MLPPSFTGTTPTDATAPVVMSASLDHVMTTCVSPLASPQPTLPIPTGASALSTPNAPPLTASTAPASPPVPPTT